MNTVLTLHDPATARRYYEEGLWRPDTFYSLLAGHATARPNAFALRDGVRRLTWREVKERTDAAAAAMHAAGIVRGQRVSLWQSNRIEAVIALLACARNGYVCNPSLHLNYTGEEIIALLGRLRAAALVVEKGYGGADDATLAAIDALPQMRRVFRLEPGRGDSAGFQLTASGT